MPFAIYLASLLVVVAGCTIRQGPRRGLDPRLPGKGLGEDWIPGYKPAFNFQGSLVDAVARRLAAHPAWLSPDTRLSLAGTHTPSRVREAPTLWIGPPPTVSNAPPPDELEQMQHIARRFDVAERDARNRALGRAGEERIVIHERSSLAAAGRDDLADRVRWVSDQDGDGAGYDVASFEADGRPRLTEVKTTNGWSARPSTSAATSWRSPRSVAATGASSVCGTSPATRTRSNCARRWTPTCR